MLNDVVRVMTNDCKSSSTRLGRIALGDVPTSSTPAPALVNIGPPLGEPSACPANKPAMLSDGPAIGGRRGCPPLLPFITPRGPTRATSGREAVGIGLPHLLVGVDDL